MFLSIDLGMDYLNFIGIIIINSVNIVPAFY